MITLRWSVAVRPKSRPMSIGIIVNRLLGEGAIPSHNERLAVLKATKSITGGR